MTAKRPVSPDVLDRQRRSALGMIYLFPGRAYLWLRYIGAPKGRVFATARQARSPIISFVTSTVFWIVAIFLLDSFYLDFAILDYLAGISS